MKQIGKRHSLAFNANVVRAALIGQHTKPALEISGCPTFTYAGLPESANSNGSSPENLCCNEQGRRSLWRHVASPTSSRRRILICRPEHSLTRLEKDLRLPAINWQNPGSDASGLIWGIRKQEWYHASVKRTEQDMKRMRKEERP